MDIVDAALDAAAERDAEADPDAFADPRVCLLGYGRLGATPVEQGWASDRPNADAAHAVTAEELPEAVADADYVLLVGARADHDLAGAIAGAVPAGATRVAVPLGAPTEPARTVGSADATIPCARTHGREFVTDLLAVLTGRVHVSPPPQFYRRLPTVGRLHGFRGVREGVDSASPTALAEQLVDDALANPFDAGGDGEGFFGFLRAGEGLTLREFDAVRAETADRFGAGDGPAPFAADVTTGLDGEYRLTLLRR